MERAETGLLTERRRDFETFFEAEYERLLRAMFLVSGDRSEAEDLAQGAMAKAFEHWDRVARADSPASYLYTIALNLHRSTVRRAIRPLRQHLPARFAPDPAEVVHARDEIVTAMIMLPVTQREALVLVAWMGMTAEEAGALLGIKAVSVRARVHRARATLARKFGDDDG
jgi:RNA polymerase sigma-70 factor, ECF subfamily